MNLELRHLKVVCAIAETGSVTKAASLLGLAQPALTAQLQRIERTLGGPLFERDRRGARPTALGELVLSRARVLLPAMKGLQDEAARLAGAGSDDAMSRYRIGASGGPVVGGMVHRLSEAQPDAQISTHASYYVDELATMVLAGKLDYAQVGVCGDAIPSADYGLVWQTIAVDGGVRADAGGPPGAPRASTSTWPSWPRSSGRPAPATAASRDCFAAACARAGFTPRRVLETDIRGVVDMVESGLRDRAVPADLPAAGRADPPAAGRRAAALAAGAGLASGQPGRPDRAAADGHGGRGVPGGRRPQPDVRGMAGGLPAIWVGTSWPPHN